MAESPVHMIAREVFLASLVGDTGHLGNMMHRIAHEMDDVTLAKDEPLYKAGEHSEHFFFLVSGEIQLTRPGAAASVFHERMAVGTLDATMDRPHTHSAVATKPTRILRLRAGTWMDLLEEDFELTRRIISRLATDVHRMRLRPPPQGGFDPPAERVVTTGNELQVVDRILQFQQVPAFALAGTQTLAALAQLGSTRFATKDGQLLAPDEMNGQLVVVASGEVRATWEGSTVAAEFRGGSLVGGASALGAGAAPDVRSTTQTRAIVFFGGRLFRCHGGPLRPGSVGSCCHRRRTRSLARPRGVSGTVDGVETRSVDAFLLSREYRETDDGLEVVLWARAKEAPVRVVFTRLEAVMFVPCGARARGDRRAALPLTTLDGSPVDAVYFRSQRRLIDERDRIRASAGVVFESDVKPAERFLMERFITASAIVRGPSQMQDGALVFRNPSLKASDLRPTLSVLALDIETDGFDGPLLSAALASREREQVFVQGKGRAQSGFAFVPDERTLLVTLFAAIRALDPDVLVGWNVVDFDLSVLEERCRVHRLPFAIGRAGGVARVLKASRPQLPTTARVPGRVVLDGIATLKSATHRFERFTLGHVAGELLGRAKKIAAVADPVAEIRRMHRDDAAALAAYNVEDCRLVLDIFEHAGLIAFAIERAHLTGLAMDRPGGSVAAFDNLYLPRLHRKGLVAPDVAEHHDALGSPGGYVLDSVPGLFRDVLSFDFRSLYPSIIRTFQVDPWGLHQPGLDPIPGADGGTFARHGAILPGLITTLHDARSEAMKQKNEPLSRAIKILMNSFYGVLGAPGCRFFDPRLASSITRRGHAIIERTRRFFVERHLQVLYGDTDSLFVHLADARDEESAKQRGLALASELTRVLAQEIRGEFGLESHLELRFESHYLRFLMPTTRGAERGSKKRYAGTVRRHGEIAVVVRGLEAVRTDWTPLARRVQRELLRRVLTDAPFEAWLRELAKDLAAGRLDDELVYRKRVRRDLDEYAHQGAPPHVRAALAARARVLAGTSVEYLVTSHGPQLVSARDAPLDYEHYRAKQLSPVCDVVLPFLGTSFEQLAGTQTSLF